MKLIVKKTRSYKIQNLNGKKIFVKKYAENRLNIKKLVEEEYEKGKKLSNIINYPKPLNYKNNTISYEFIEIKNTLFDVLNKGNLNYRHIKKIGEFLRIIHENGMIHGDLNTINIVITEDNKLFFVDASFSEYTNQNRVMFENLNIYQDISLFLIYIKWIRSLLRPWLLLLRKRIITLTNLFLESYFKDNLKEFNPRKNAKMENKFYENYLKSIRHRENFLEYLNQIIWKRIMKLLILNNRWKFAI